MTSRFGRRLYRGDVGLGYGRDGSAINFEGDTVLALDPRTGDLRVPEAERLQGQGWTQSYVHLPDVLVETILREGVVADRPDATLGGAEVLELSRGSLKMRAVFKRFETRRRSADPPGARAEHELAAHALDRALGLDFVPVVVARSIDGDRGVVRPVLESAIDLVSIRSYGNLENAEIAEIVTAVADYFELDAHELEEQVIEASVFNALIGNPVRQDFQSLFIPAEGRVALVDHERAFPTTDEVETALREGCRPMPPDLFVGLAMLDREELRAGYSEYLSLAQIDALLTRRDRILDACGPSALVP